MGSGSGDAVLERVEGLEAVARDDQDHLVVRPDAPPRTACRSAATVTPPAVSVRMPSVLASSRIESTTVSRRTRRGWRRRSPAQAARRRVHPRASRWPASARCRVGSLHRRDDVGAVRERARDGRAAGGLATDVADGRPLDEPDLGQLIERPARAWCTASPTPAAPRPRRASASPAAGRSRTRWSWSPRRSRAAG